MKTPSLKNLLATAVVFALPSALLAVDSDSDGLDDSVETNTGVYVSPANTGTNPSVADTDGDGARDGWEVGHGSNPLSAGSFPKPANARVVVQPFNSIAGSGISPTKTYTHAISGGSAATVGGVEFQELSSTVTPANFSWEAGDTKNQVRPTDGNHLNDWVPANGGISDPELITLLSGFTYATQAWYTRTEPQRYTLDNLSKGQLYELRIYTRVWDKGGTGAPIDITFTNGQEVIQPWGGLPGNRPDYVLGNNNRDSVCFLSYLYRAQTNSLVIDAKVHPSMPWYSGSLNLYALTNEVVQDTDGDMLPDSVETNTGVFTSPTNTGTNPDDPDSDDDGINDWSEIYTHGTNPTRADTDGDGVKDKADAFPLDPAETQDSDRDGIGDNADPDDDNDGLSDADEISIHHTNPKRADSDGDGLNDRAEIETHHTNPNLADTDNDGLRDGPEVTTHHTNPLLADSDGDGFPDGYEVETGKNPLDALDKPGVAAAAYPAVEFVFFAAAGRIYRIEDSADLENWSTVETGITGTGALVQRFYSTRGTPKRYFRVEEVAP